MYIFNYFHIKHKGVKISLRVSLGYFRTIKKFFVSQCLNILF